MQPQQREQLLKLVERLVTNTQWDAEKQRYVIPKPAAASSASSGADSPLDEKWLRKLRHSVKGSSTRIHTVAVALLEWLTAKKRDNTSSTKQSASAVRSRPPAKVLHRLAAAAVIDDFFDRSKKFRHCIIRDIAIFISAVVDPEHTDDEGSKRRSRSSGRNGSRSARTSAEDTAEDRAERKLRRRCLRMLQKWVAEHGAESPQLRAAYAGLRAHGVKFPRPQRNTTGAASMSAGQVAGQEGANARELTDATVAEEQRRIQFLADEAEMETTIEQTISTLDSVDCKMAQLVPMLSALSATASGKLAEGAASTEPSSHAQGTVIVDSSDDDNDDSSDDGDIADGEGEVVFGCSDASGSAVVDVKLDRRTSEVVWETADADPALPSQHAAGPPNTKDLSAYSNEEFAQLVGLGGAAGVGAGVLEVTLTTSKKIPSSHMQPLRQAASRRGPISARASASSSTAVPSISGTMSPEDVYAQISESLKHLRTVAGPMLKRWAKILQGMDAFEAFVRLREGQRRSDAGTALSLAPIDSTVRRGLLQSIRRARERLRVSKARFRTLSVARAEPEEDGPANAAAAQPPEKRRRGSHQQ